jgi:hypothetical protein
MKKNLDLGESRGLVVKGQDSQLSGCGFESRHRILDGVSEPSYYIEKGNKGSQMGHTKKIFKIKNKIKIRFCCRSCLMLSHCDSKLLLCDITVSE